MRCAVGDPFGARPTRVYIPGRGKVLGVRSNLGTTVFSPMGDRCRHYPADGGAPMTFAAGGSLKKVFAKISRLFNSKGSKRVLSEAKTILAPVAREAANKALEMAVEAAQAKIDQELSGDGLRVPGSDGGALPLIPIAMSLLPSLMPLITDAMSKGRGVDGKGAKGGNPAMLAALAPSIIGQIIRGLGVSGGTGGANRAALTTALINSLAPEIARLISGRGASGGDMNPRSTASLAAARSGEDPSEAEMAAVNEYMAQYMAGVGKKGTSGGKLDRAQYKAYHMAGGKINVGKTLAPIVAAALPALLNELGKHMGRGATGGNLAQVATAVLPVLIPEIAKLLRGEGLRVPGADGGALPLLPIAAAVLPSLIPLLGQMMSGKGADGGSISAIAVPIAQAVLPALIPEIGRLLRGGTLEVEGGNVLAGLAMQALPMMIPLISKLVQGKGPAKGMKGGALPLLPIAAAVLPALIPEISKLLSGGALVVPDVGVEGGSMLQMLPAIMQMAGPMLGALPGMMGSGNGEAYAARFAQEGKNKKASAWFDRHDNTGGAFKSALQYKGPNETLGESSYDRAERALGRGGASEEDKRRASLLGMRLD